jgi:hypothetical protein
MRVGNMSENCGKTGRIQMRINCRRGGQEMRKGKEGRTKGMICEMVGKRWN